MIGFNRPYITGKEFDYIKAAIKLEKLSGNGFFTKKCHEFFQKRYGFSKALLTHSATAALEMAAILIDTRPGDEVIIPSYTFVSTANAFILRGATIVFADSQELNPNVSVEQIRPLITKKTKAIVVVHYAGFACDMDPIMELATERNIFVIEDAAQAIDSFYKGRPLGSIGHLAAFSFHETKNIISGEGGMLIINDERFLLRSEIIWEKGTNRAAFSRKEVNKYNWIDVGSSFLPSELTAAFLLAQLEKIDFIQNKRKENWTYYFGKLDAFREHYKLGLPKFDDFGTNNAHMFYITVSNLQERDEMLQYLKHYGIQAIFHYLPLHDSPYFKSLQSESLTLPNAERFGNTLIRLPFYLELSQVQMDLVVEKVFGFYNKAKASE
ncbi:MAG: dTDP-4-amino-4,6-dideoxygalactose transaminase [Cyclobacteriaceae bacterium]